MSVEETKRPIQNFDFHGQWIPSADPLLIGGKNFSIIRNQMPCANGLEGILGYSRIATLPLLESLPYIATNGIQLRQETGTPSRIFVQAVTPGTGVTALLEQTATDPTWDDVPNPLEFDPSPIHQDAPGAGLGRFAAWPMNQIAYCNGKETLIYGGDEMQPDVFFVADSPITGAVTNVIDYTDAVRNDLRTPGNLAYIGAGSATTAPVDVNLTKLHLTMTGAAGTPIIDISPAVHGTATKIGAADISLDHSLYGSGVLSTPTPGSGVTYVDNPDWDAPSGNKITYEVQHYLSSISNTLTSQNITLTILGNNSASIILDGNHTTTTWLQSGHTFLMTAAATPAPSTVVSTVYNSGTDKTTVTFSNPSIVAAQSLSATNRITITSGMFPPAFDWGPVMGPLLPGDQSATPWLQPGCIVIYDPFNSGPDYSNYTFVVQSIYYHAPDNVTFIVFSPELPRYMHGTTGPLAEATDTQTTLTGIDIGEVLSVFGRYQDNQNFWYLYFSALTGYVLNCTIAGDEKTGLHTDTNQTTEFNHVAVICDGTNLHLYVKGNYSQATTTGVVFPAWNAPLCIGRTQCADAQYTESSGSYFAQFLISHSDRQADAWGNSPTPYLTKSSCFVLGTRRPIRYVKPYIHLSNSSTARLTGQRWSGQAWSQLGISDASLGLSQDEGIIDLGAAALDAKPKLLAGKLFYFYIFTLPSGSAQLYKLTVHAPWQPICDLWDGTFRPVLSARHYHDNLWINDTMNVLEQTAEGVTGTSAYVMSIGGMAALEYIDLAVSERACAFKIIMYERETGKVNTNPAIMTCHYWNGGGYTLAEGQLDETSKAGNTLAQSGFVSFTPPSPGQEYQATEFGETFWYYRLVFSAALSADVWIDQIISIPAPQLQNREYVFPFMFQNRPMLCNLTSTGEGNRVDYPMTNSTEGWNGEDSSLGDGKTSLYIGGQSALTAACEIYNRLGSSIYTFALFFKAHETYILNGYDYDTYKAYPLNNKIGCPAPLTLDTFTATDTKESQSAKSIAAWLSFMGVYIFDSGGLTAIPGIESYFDKNNENCINLSAIHVSRGWFDPDLPQYNLQIPVGYGQTSNNTWLVYDLNAKHWYPKYPDAGTENPFLTTAIRVKDAHDQEYIYSARLDGSILRLQNGTSWDGYPIVQVIETGEILPSGNVWDLTKITRFKIFFKPFNETATLTVTMYKNGSETGQVIATIPLAGTERFVRFNKKLAYDAASTYRFRFDTSTSSSVKGMQLLAWSFKYTIDHIDDQEVPRAIPSPVV